MTVGYRPDADGVIVNIASRLRALLGHETGATHMHNVRALVAAGKTLDAIRVLREEAGMSLVDAKRRVENIAAVNENGE
jgi:ribosomal protein L7/L12